MDQITRAVGDVVGQLAHPEVVDNEQRHGGQVGEEILAGAVDAGVSDLLDEDVGLALHDSPRGGRFPELEFRLIRDRGELSRRPVDL